MAEVLMRWGAWFWGVLLTLGVSGVAEAQGGSVPAAALGSESPTVLVAPVQGTVGVRHAYSARVGSAVGEALEKRGYAAVADEARGEALVACGALACIEQTLGGVGAAFGLVPAMWVRKGDRRELTLTLVGKSGRSLNAGTVINGDLRRTAAELVDELLTRRDELEANDHEDLATAPFPIGAAGSASVGRPETGNRIATAVERDEPAAHPHAWKAGPIVLLAGGTAAFVAIGAAAGMRTANQRLNKGAVAAWSVVGAAALAGGAAWWVVGEKRRRGGSEQSGATPDAAIRVSPSGFDLRLRF